MYFFSGDEICLKVMPALSVTSVNVISCGCGVGTETAMNGMSRDETSQTVVTRKTEDIFECYGVV